MKKVTREDWMFVMYIIRAFGALMTGIGTLVLLLRRH
jgi:hypothetical protein